MKRISKSIGLSIFSLVLANSVGHAAESKDDQLVSAGAMKISIISASVIAGGSSLYGAFQQSEIATAREGVHGGTVFNGTAAELLPASRVAGEPTIIERVLRGTAEGDVVRLEFSVGTEEAFERAVADLKRGIDSWSNRLSELSAQRPEVAERASTARQIYNGLPLNEQSKERRYYALVELEKAEAKLKRLDRMIADTDMRFHSMRGQYAAGVRNLGVTHQNHKVNQSYPLIRDIYLNGQPGQLDGILNTAMGETTLAARANRDIPHIRISRYLTPNGKLISRSLRNVKAGLWAAGISAALILEEVAVGEISQDLAEKTKTHYSPEVRIEPSGAAGRRY